MHVIVRDKGCLTSCGLTGHGLHGYSLSFLLFFFLTDHFCFSFFSFKCCFVWFVVCVHYSCAVRGEVEDYIKCKLIGGGSPRHLNSIANLFIVAEHYTHINTCYALLLLLLCHVHHVVHYNISDGSSSASFKDLVTLHRRTLHQIF